MRKVIVKTNVIFIFEEELSDDDFVLTDEIKEQYDKTVVKMLASDGVKTIHIQSNFEVKEYEKENN